MSQTIKENTDIFFNKKKENEFKKDIVRKSILCILLTNIVTYLILKEDNIQAIQKRVTTQGMVTLNIALDSYIPNDYDGLVKLIGPHNEIITVSARIEEKTAEKTDFESKQLPIYVVSVKNIDGHKFVKYQNHIIRAYPQSLNIENKKYVGGPREIQF